MICVFIIICLLQRLSQLQTQEQELNDYKPHCYAHEGEPNENFGENLDTLSISEPDFHPDFLIHLTSRFTNLAAVCRPDLMSSSTQN